MADILSRIYRNLIFCITLYKCQENSATPYLSKSFKLFVLKRGVMNINTHNNMLQIHGKHCPPINFIVLKLKVTKFETFFF